MSLDKNKSDFFSRKMCDILNYGALNLAVGIGYETGLFETLELFSEPRSCDDISKKAQVNSRYLFEWLGVMVAGEIIEVSRDENGQELFFLPREHVPFLCRSGGNSNLGVYAQEIPLLTECVKSEVVRNIKSGAGIPYSRYQRFYSFMEELAEAKHRQVLLSVFLPSVESGNLVKRLESGISVCDIGCADGLVLRLMAKEYPNSNFTGYDISKQSIDRAKNYAATEGLNNIHFELRDAAGENLPKNCFDYITAFDSIHDQTRPLEALKNIAAMLKPDGLFSMIDIAAHSSVSGNKDHPMGSFLYTVSLMHCMPVGLVEHGTGLGMMWGQEKAVEVLNNAGFSKVEVLEIPQDGFNSHYVCRR